MTFLPWPTTSAAEVFFVCYQFGWVDLFVSAGLWTSAIVAGFVGACVVGLRWVYCCHLDRRLFVLEAPGSPRKLKTRRSGPLAAH